METNEQIVNTNLKNINILQLDSVLRKMNQSCTSRKTLKNK